MNKRPPPTNGNPYGRAAHNYASQEKKQETTRETEARTLLKAAKMLQELQGEWDAQAPKKLQEVIRFNREIWVLFYDNALNGNDDKRPKGLSTNVVSLANFIFKKSVEILAAPEPKKLTVLININREIAGGLMAKPSSK